MRDVQKNPSANFVVTYEKRFTRNAKLVGRVASTLTADRYGSKEWWILLERAD